MITRHLFNFGHPIPKRNLVFHIQPICSALCLPGLHICKLEIQLIVRFDLIISLLPNIRPTSQKNIGQLYMQKEHYESLKEMMIPYMFTDKSGEDLSDAHEDNGYGFQENSRIREIATNYIKYVNGIDTRAEQQRELGLRYMIK